MSPFPKSMGSPPVRVGLRQEITYASPVPLRWNYARPLHPLLAPLGDVARVFSITIWALERVASLSLSPLGTSDAPMSVGAACCKNIGEIVDLAQVGAEEGVINFSMHELTSVNSVVAAPGRVGVKEAWRCSLRTSENCQCSVQISLATVSFN